MAALRNLFGKKDGDRNHLSWRKLCIAWYKIQSMQNSKDKDWNPWMVWCKSWEEFESSNEKPPKSEKLKAAMFLDLFTIAKLTRDKLEEGKAMRTYLEQITTENDSLRNQNSMLLKNCEELQSKLEAEKRAMVANDLFHKYNLEKEINAQKALEAQKDYLTFQVQQKEEELRQAQAKCRELENKLSSSQGQLVECRKKHGSQVNVKNDITVIYGPNNKWNKPSPLPELENGEGEKSLSQEELGSIINRLGEVTNLNVLDWLCSCEEEYKIWEWSGKDFEKILHRCMDSGSFSSLLPKLRKDQPSWLDKCVHIAEMFISDLPDKLDTEEMREDEKVLQYFHRMWMIYRITFYPLPTSKDQTGYKTAICDGLPPHLYEDIIRFRSMAYEVIEQAALRAEHSWLESERKKQDWYMKTRKAGAGCPSRYKIWKRLEKHDVPYEEINGAPFWTLVVKLSREEDLGTGEKITHIEYE